MKITLSDKKVIQAFLDKKDLVGRVLISEGGILKAIWSKPIIVAKWTKKGDLFLIPTTDRGVLTVQRALTISDE